MVAYLSELGKRVGGSTRGYGPSLVCSTCKDGRSRHLGAVPRTVWRRATGEVLGAVVAHRAPESVLAAQHSCTRPAGRRLHPTAHPPLCKAVWHAAVYVPSGGNFLTFWTFLETSAVPLTPVSFGHSMQCRRPQRNGTYTQRGTHGRYKRWVYPLV